LIPTSPRENRNEPNRRTCLLNLLSRYCKTQTTEHLRLASLYLNNFLCNSYTCLQESKCAIPVFWMDKHQVCGDPLVNLQNSQTTNESLCAMHIYGKTNQSIIVMHGHHMQHPQISQCMLCTDMQRSTGQSPYQTDIHSATSGLATLHYVQTWKDQLISHPTPQTCSVIHGWVTNHHMPLQKVGRVSQPGINLPRKLRSALPPFNNVKLILYFAIYKNKGRLCQATYNVTLLSWVHCLMFFDVRKIFQWCVYLICGY
jgi:hypothetical protein